MPPEQNSTGVTLPYEKQAMRGDVMPSGLSCPDQFMFQALAFLYARYRIGAVTRERATSEKKELLEQYRVYKFQWDMGDRWTNLIKRTEEARTEYRKNKTIENADQLLCCIDGVKNYD